MICKTCSGLIANPETSFGWHGKFCECNGPWPFKQSSVTVRLLSKQELADAYELEGDYREVIQQKFCEVNNLSLKP